MIKLVCMKKKILSLVLGFSFLFISLSAVSAQVGTHFEFKGPAVNKELFAIGDVIRTGGDLNGSAFQVAANLTSSSNVDGILFSAGQNVFLSGQSEYLFSAGNLVNIKGSVLKDAFIAGNAIILENANLGRDLYAAGNALDLSGNFGRNVFVAGNSVVLSGNFEGSVVVEATAIEILEGTNIKGELRYNEDAKIKIADTASIGSQTTFVSKIAQKDKVSENLFLSTLKAKSFGFVNVLVLGVLFIALFGCAIKKLSERNNKITFAETAKKFGIGFLVLIVAPILFIIGLITVVGISSSFILLFLYIALFLLAKVFVGYLLGREIILKGFKKSKANDYASFFLGIVILFLLGLIPVAGDIINFIVFCLGLGLGFNLVFTKDKKETNRVEIV